MVVYERSRAVRPTTLLQMRVDVVGRLRKQSANGDPFDVFMAHATEIYVEDTLPINSKTVELLHFLHVRQIGHPYSWLYT